MSQYFRQGEEGEPGEMLAAGKIYDSNRYTTMSALERLGCVVDDLGILQDSPEKLPKRSERPRDHMMYRHKRRHVGGRRRSRRKSGIRQREPPFLAPRNQARPPCISWTGSRRRWKRGFIGLPGNPVAAMVTFLLIGRPLVLRLGGATGNLASGLSRNGRLYS